MSGDVHQHRQAYAYCAYCPKVCRFSCPVSEATQNESLSAWGKMTEAHLVTENKRPVDESGAKALYGCTGCMRCRSFCKHENEVGFALFGARAEALKADVAPKAVTSTLKTFAEHQNPFGKSLGDAVAKFRADAPVRFQFFPGCTSVVKRSELVEDALAIGKALGAPLGIGRPASRCCGYPLYAAGDTEAFQTHAAQMAVSLKELSELVVMDPGCAYTLKVVYPRVGVTLKPKILTVYEVFAERLEHTPGRAPLEMKVSYHDACHLGRGLGQYDEPRRLLRAATSHVSEQREQREEGGCSGGGGLLPRTMPEASVEIAKRQAARVSPEGEVVVTACPTSRRMFERAGRPSEDMLRLVRRWLEAKGEG